MFLKKRTADHDPQELVFPGRGGVKIKQVSESFNRAVSALKLNEEEVANNEKRDVPEVLRCSSFLNLHSGNHLEAT